MRLTTATTTTNALLLWAAIHAAIVPGCNSLAFLQRRVADEPEAKNATTKHDSHSAGDDRGGGGGDNEQATASEQLAAILRNDDDEQQQQSFVGLERDFVETFRQVSPSVAMIRAYDNASRKNSPTNFFAGFSNKKQVISVSTGSGFLWDEEHIVTAYHVLSDDGIEKRWNPLPGITVAEQRRPISPRLVVTVKLIGVPEEFDAEVIGVDATHDIAVLKLVFQNNTSSTDGSTLLLNGTDHVADSRTEENDEVKQLPDPVRLGTSKNLQEGQSVLAIGRLHNGCHRGTLKAGVVSALGGMLSESSMSINSRIFIDASLQDGFSGSPLLDSQSRLIGMNIEVLKKGEMGVAVPVDTVARVVNQIIQHGEAFDPKLGIAGSWGSHLNSGRKGIFIGRTIPNSPAASTNLEATVLNPDGSYSVLDLIIGVDGRLLYGMVDFFATMDRKYGDEIVELIVSRWRDGVGELIEVIPIQVTTENILNRKLFDKNGMNREQWATFVKALEPLNLQILEL